MTLKPSPRTLGPDQRSILRAMKDHGSWYQGCGWIWSNDSTTVRLLESLAQRGYVRRTLRPAGVEHLTGRDLVPYLLFEYIDPRDDVQAAMDRLVKVLNDAVRQYNCYQDTGLTFVPDALLVKLARTATEFFEGGSDD
jgi:hypothetical protein